MDKWEVKLSCKDCPYFIDYDLICTLCGNESGICSKEDCPIILPEPPKP